MDSIDHFVAMCFVWFLAFGLAAGDGLLAAVSMCSLAALLVTSLGVEQ